MMNKSKALCIASLFSVSVLSTVCA